MISLCNLQQFLDFMNEAIWLAEMFIMIFMIIMIGKHRIQWLMDILPLLPITMNLFVTKIIMLFGVAVPCGDVVAIAYGLGLNIITYQLGAQTSSTILNRSILLMITWCFLAFSHVIFIPIPDHEINTAHQLLFYQTPWIYLSSLAAFYISQYADRAIFLICIKYCSFTISHALSMLFSQCIDTGLFTFIGLYYLTINPYTVILWSLTIKSIGWLISIIGVNLFYDNHSERI